MESYVEERLIKFSWYFLFYFLLSGRIKLIKWHAISIPGTYGTIINMKKTGWINFLSNVFYLIIRFIGIWMYINNIINKTLRPWITTGDSRIDSHYKKVSLNKSFYQLNVNYKDNNNKIQKKIENLEIFSRWIS